MSKIEISGKFDSVHVAGMLVKARIPFTHSVEENPNSGHYSSDFEVAEEDVDLAVYNVCETLGLGSAIVDGDFRRKPYG